MGIKYSFVDNEMYGTDDINAIAGCLIGSGIAPFLSKDSYSVSDLNSLTAALTTPGTDLDGCSCTVEGGGTAEMCVKVSQGIVFFESGVRLIVDSEGYTVAVEPNTGGYVYAHYSPSLQKADIVFSALLPADGEYVMLAELKSDGDLCKTRSVARSKIGTLGTNVVHTSEFVSLAAPVRWVDGAFGQSYTYIIAELEGVDISKFNYAHIGGFGGSTMGMFDIKQNRLLYRISGDSCQRTGATDQRLSTLITYELYMFVSVIDGRLCLLLGSDSGRYIDQYANITYTVTLI